jgi:hypothetical protein
MRATLSQSHQSYLCCDYNMQIRCCQDANASKMVMRVQIVGPPSRSSGLFDVAWNTAKSGITGLTVSVIADLDPARSIGMTARRRFAAASRIGLSTAIRLIWRLDERCCHTNICIFLATDAARESHGSACGSRLTKSTAPWACAEKTHWCAVCRRRIAVCARRCPSPAMPRQIRASIAQTSAPAR